MEIATNYISDHSSVQFMFMQVALAFLCAIHLLKAGKPRLRRLWVHPLNQRRINKETPITFALNERYEPQFLLYTRLMLAQFDKVLKYKRIADEIKEL